MARAGSAAGQAGTAYFGDRAVPRGEKSALVRDVFRDVAGRYDLMNDLMSGGVHRLWKSAMVAWLNPVAPLRVVDVAGGTGDIALRMWKRLNAGSGANYDGHIIVCDLTEAMVATGRDRAADQGVAADIEWVTGDAQALPLADGSQDAYTIAFGIRNVTDLAAALGEAYRVLRWGGRFLCLEFCGPVAPGLDRLYEAYAGTIPWLGDMVTGNGDAYRYLIESIRRFPNRDAFAAAMEIAGFSRVHVRPLSGGIATLFSGWRI